MTSVCPFAKSACPDDASRRKSTENNKQPEHESKDKKESSNSSRVSPKCPFGYDSHSFKLGPLSCVICQALLFESSKCEPCSHKFCKACVSRFRDCPLCGADIDRIEPDNDLQATVDRFIEGHARIKRLQVDMDSKEINSGNKKVIYEDVSLERGAFLVQQAMRAFRAQNISSAKSRLSLCAEDIREQIEILGNTSELCSQLGAVLGMLGDCWRSKMKVPNPDIPMRIRAEKALEAIYVCCFGRDPIEKEDEKLLCIMLNAVFPSVGQSEMATIVSEKAKKVAEGGEENNFPEPKALTREAIKLQMKDLQFLQQNDEK